MMHVQNVKKEKDSNGIGVKLAIHKDMQSVLTVKQN